MLDHSRAARVSPAERIATSAIRRSLQNAEVGFRRQHGIPSNLLLLTPEINMLRARVSKEFGVELPPLKTPLHEGSYGGRERDPEWAAYMESSWRSVCFKYLGAPSPLTLADHVRIGIRPLRSLYIEAEDLAAASMRATERDATRALCGRRRVA